MVFQYILSATYSSSSLPMALRLTGSSSRAYRAYRSSTLVSVCRGWLQADEFLDVQAVDRYALLSRVRSESRSSTYMSQGPSWSVVFIQLTLSTSRMFAVTPRRAICSLITVVMTLNTLFSVSVISSNVSGLDGP